ncbi:hypothetical protein [Nonomuraea jiangxiensis]|uniref:Beta/Gamma crystallin n=1 Tax=Nonomuraea jiangxiensis TaxID=633440 RepID=A0A1G7ZJI8_9ACTN|nr:hypothetical protein [Nonomuraea jiangxiensis]SDH08726.1 hypothetical protein SAMN05421869_101431 [Nonomuraea jiangxiensis]
MRMRNKATFAVASMAATMFACSTAAPASSATVIPTTNTATTAGTQTALDVVRGKTRCFSYSYGDNGTTSVTVYFHNRCKHSRGIKIRVAQAPDACIWVRGGDFDKKKFKGARPTVQSIKEVSHCG